MAAAFPGLQDRLEHLTSVLVIKLGDAVEVEKLDDEEAEAPISPPIVGDGDDVAERTLLELAIVDEPLADDSTALVVTDKVLVGDWKVLWNWLKSQGSECCIPELPLCPDTVVFNVVLEEIEAVFDVDELIDVGSPG
jgi:hypothetical protein